VTAGRYTAERAIVDSAAAGRAFFARALAAGHEGVMAKDLTSAYEPGGRGKRWFKLKESQTVDCVIIAVDRGSGRRAGWLSNYHLAVRDDGGFADVGKTFKGLTDQQFREMTERLWALAVADDGYTVRVRPDVVVEVAYNEIQKSPTYPSGFALRFARITRVREDKTPARAAVRDDGTREGRAAASMTRKRGERAQLPRYARCTAGSAASSTLRPSRATRPASSTYARPTVLNACRAFCSTRSMVRPPRTSAAMAAKTRLTTIGASPSEASSTSKRRGAPMRARPMAHICCSPPDRVFASWVARSWSAGKSV
jgi:hypothetical protein